MRALTGALAVRWRELLPRQSPTGCIARPDGRVGSSLRELLAFVLAFARSYG